VTTPTEIIRIKWWALAHGQIAVWSDSLLVGRYDGKLFRVSLKENQATVIDEGKPWRISEVCTTKAQFLKALGADDD